MNIELTKFIEDLDEYFKNIPLTEEHISRLCSFIGAVEITVELHRSNSGNTITCKKMPLHCLASVEDLKEEIKKIVQGNRADIIYSYQEFVDRFVHEEEEGEEDEEID